MTKALAKDLVQKKGIRVNAGKPRAVACTSAALSSDDYIHLDRSHCSP